ncbi:MAG TPA: hypothetical protein VEI82_15205, partial [Myxococcota bacterium]|nr:hypothetical protein [Myxococcota bacterium]
ARSADFDLLSTFVIQRQPDVAEALRRMHQAVVPDFEWLWGRGGVPLGPLSFMLSGFAALALCGDAWLAASGLATALYLGFADATLSSHWFRLWLGIFPPFCLAAGQVAQRAARSRSRARRAGAALLVLLLGFGAFGWLQPAPEIALERVTPPPELLQDSAYLVTSAFYPESLSYRFPDKRFIGMPLHASEFAEFAAAFPGYDAVLWKSIGIQSELIDALTLRDGYALAGAATNRYGVKWAVLKKPESR